MSCRRFSFVRHGKVNGPAALYGKTDIALSEIGLETLLQSLQQLAQQQPIDAIVTSPLTRCAQAAAVFAKRQQLPFTIMNEWQECDFGDWDGVNFNVLENQWPQLEKFWQAPLDFTPPKGENLQEFSLRINKAWERLLAHTTAKHTLIVCHGGSIRMMLASLLNIPLSGALFQQLHIDYCSHTCIELSDHPAAKPIIRWIGAAL